MMNSNIKILGRTIACCNKFFHTSPVICKVIPKNLKGKSKGAQDWLTRQLNDPYVKKAKKELYRARSAYKLLEINEKAKILRPGLGVIECGCSPGSWTQVLVKYCNGVVPNDQKPVTYDASQPEGRVVGLDLLPTSPVPGAICLANADCNDPKTWSKALELIKPLNVDLVLSDMAPNATGVSAFDHEKILQMVFTVARFAIANGNEGSNLLVKVWHGGLVQKYTTELLKYYERVKIIKPPCSRDHSSEIYVLALKKRKVIIKNELKR